MKDNPHPDYDFFPPKRPPVPARVAVGLAAHRGADGQLLNRFGLPIQPQPPAAPEAARPGGARLAAWPAAPPSGGAWPAAGGSGAASEFPAGTEPMHPARLLTPLQPQQLRAPKRRRLPAWAIALLTVTSGLLVIVVIAAVAVPAFNRYQDRQNWRDTTFVLPDEVASYQRTTFSSDSATAELASMGAQLGFLPEQSAKYVNGDRGVVVWASRSTRPLSRDRQQTMQAGVRLLLERFGSGFHSLDADPYPGVFGCAQSRLLCQSVDSAGMILIVVTGPDDDPVATARTFRAAVETRRG